MRLLRGSFRARLLLYFMLLSFVPLLAVGAMAYLSGRQAIIDNVEAHLESIATLKEQAVVNLLQYTSQDLDVLALDYEVRDAVAVMSTTTVDSAQYREARQLLLHDFEMMAARESASPIFLLDGDSGMIVVASHPGWEGKFRDSAAYFLKGRKGSYISDMFYSFTLERPAFAVSTPLRHSDGRLLGVLAGYVNMDRLNEIMTEWSGLGDTGETFLVSRSNLLVTDTVFDPGSAFGKWIFGVGAVRALRGERGIDLFRDYRDEPVIGAYRPILEGELALIAKQDQAEAFAPINQLRTTIALMGGILIVLAAGMAVVLARQTTSPLARLAAYARRITQGEYEAQLDIRGTDEIASVSADVQNMVERLRHEIRQRHEMQEMLLRHERLAVLGQLAGGVGHELRNPLGVIRNVAYYLKMVLKQPEPRVAESLNQMDRAVTRADRIIGSLLDFARKRPLALRMGDVNEVIAVALSHVDVPDNTTVVTDLDEALPPIPIDPDQLAQVFSNIALNAVQSMPEGGRLTVKSERLGPEWVSISFADTGVGLSPEDRGKVFQPLFTTKATGIGLGLALSMMIVNGHGGSIDVQSEPGRGSMFTVRLPLRLEEEGEAGERLEPDATCVSELGLSGDGESRSLDGRGKVGVAPAHGLGREGDM